MDEELYEKPLHTEGNIWAGHDRNSILSNIEAGLHYLNTTDLVGLHATISAIQISREHSLEEDENMRLRDVRGGM